MCDVGDVFAADMQHYDHCCKSYMNKYHAKIEEIMRSLEMEDSVSATNDSLKENFLADFSKSTHSLTSIRDKPNKDSTKIFSEL